MTPDTDLINQLTASLTPRASMRPLALWPRAVTLWLMALAAILFILGLRPDHAAALDNGMLLFKPLLFALPSAALLYAVATLTLPLRPLSRLAMIPHIVAVLCMGAFLWHDLTQNTLTALLHGLTDPRAVYCFVTVLLAGTALWLGLYMVWLRHGIALRAAQTGMITGAASGFLSATAYAFHCANDNPLYILVYYSAPIIILSIIGRILGARLLRW